MGKYYSEVRVIYADTDGMGIVYNGNYVRWFEVGRTEYLRQIGYAYSELEKQGMSLPVRSLECYYKAPALYDDVLEIASWVSKLGGASIEIQYEIKRKDTGQLLVNGMTQHAVTDSKLKPIRFKNLYPDFYARVVETME